MQESCIANLIGLFFKYKKPYDVTIYMVKRLIIVFYAMSWQEDAVYTDTLPQKILINNSGDFALEIERLKNEARNDAAVYV